MTSAVRSAAQAVRIEDTPAYQALLRRTLAAESRADAAERRASSVEQENQQVHRFTFDLCAVPGKIIGHAVKALCAVLRYWQHDTWLLVDCTRLGASIGASRDTVGAALAALVDIGAIERKYDTGAEVVHGVLKPFKHLYIRIVSAVFLKPAQWARAEERKHGGHRPKKFVCPSCGSDELNMTCRHCGYSAPIADAVVDDQPSQEQEERQRTEGTWTAMIEESARTAQEMIARSAPKREAFQFEREQREAHRQRAKIRLEEMRARKAAQEAPGLSSHDTVTEDTDAPTRGSGTPSTPADAPQAQAEQELARALDGLSYAPHQPCQKCGCHIQRLVFGVASCANCHRSPLWPQRHVETFNLIYSAKGVQRGNVPTA